MTTTLRDRICRECGRRFEGGPRAWYCPECRCERDKAQNRAYKARRRIGMTRPLGSVDHCTVCGAAYTVTGPNQRYCPTCAPDAIAAVDRQQALDWYRDNRDHINPVRNAKRRAQREHTMPRTGRPKTTPQADNPVASLRRSRGWSQDEAARALGVSRTSVSRYESGRLPVPGPVRLLCAALMAGD